MGEFILGALLPWATLVALLALFLGTLLHFRSIIKVIIHIPNRIKFLFILIIIAGFISRFFYTENYHKIYYDEDRYLSYAVTFERFGKATSIEFATPTQIILGKPDKAGRVTIPIVNATGIKIFGNSEDVLFTIAKTASLLQVILVFLFSYLLFKNYTVSLFSSLLMALLPIEIYWAPSLALDSYHVFFSLVASVAVVLYAKKPILSNQILLISSVFLLLGVRIESFSFLVILIALFIAVRKSEHRFIYKTDLIPFSILCGLIGFRTLASISVLGQPWCCAEALPLESFAPNYFFRNLLPNIFDLLKRPEFPGIIILLAAYTLIKKSSAYAYILWFWVLLFFLLYSTYYAGKFFTFEFSGSYGRYLLMLVPPLIILASIPLTNIFSHIFKRGLKSSFMYLFLFLGITLFFIPTALSYPTLIKSSPYFNMVEAGPKVYHEFLVNEFLLKTKQNDIIIHSLTAHPLLDSRTTIFIGYFFDGRLNDFLVSSLKSGKKAYILETYQCEVLPESCKKLNGLFIFKPVKKTTSNADISFSEVILSEKAY